VAISHILGIETSCDETSAAVVRIENGRPGGGLRSLVILSQDIHRVFGGVVPELASREHLRTIGPVVERSLAEAGIGLSQLDGIAVTAGPGLIGALLVGLMYGKGLAFGLAKPFLGVHHLEGHLFAPLLEEPTLEPPLVALLVSGGHTLLLDVEAWGDYRLLGETLDDAAGEAFDKVGTLLGLEYPAGATVEKLALQGSPGRYQFPRPMIREGFAFSFSGLKTAVLRAVRASSDPEADRNDLARGFQDAIIEVLVEKTARAVGETGRTTVVIGGGVACNRTLAAAMKERLNGKARVVVASPRLNTDNAAMIAAAGAWRLARGERSSFGLEPFDSGPLPGLTESPESRVRSSEKRVST
jgi:N6-L-threonylcarbamoyladenine synthase